MNVISNCSSWINIAFWWKHEEWYDIFHLIVSFIYSGVYFSINFLFELHQNCNSSSTGTKFVYSNFYQYNWDTMNLFYKIHFKTTKKNRTCIPAQLKPVVITLVILLTKKFELYISSAKMFNKLENWHYQIVHSLYIGDWIEAAKWKKRLMSKFKTVYCV